MLSDDFARRDLFGEVVSMILNQAIEPLASEFCLLHPDFIFVTLEDFKIDPLMKFVPAVRKDTYAPLPFGLSWQCCITNFDFPQPLPTVIMITIIGTSWIDSYPRIVAMRRIVDSEAYWLIVIEGQYFDVR